MQSTGMLLVILLSGSLLTACEDGSTRSLTDPAGTNTATQLLSVPSGELNSVDVISFSVTSFVARSDGTILQPGPLSEITGTSHEYSTCPITDPMPGCATVDTTTTMATSFALGNTEPFSGGVFDVVGFLGGEFTLLGSGLKLNTGDNLGQFDWPATDEITLAATLNGGCTFQKWMIGSPFGGGITVATSPNVRITPQNGTEYLAYVIC